MSHRGALVDCWKRIGVYGDSSCEVLHEAAHCRYCSVYRSTATYVLDKPAPLEYTDDATRLAAAPPPETNLSYSTSLIFRLGDEWMALPSSVCQEISPRRRAHTIPGRRDGYIIGVVNVRGELVIQVSLERVLGISADEGQRIAAGPKAERLVVIQKQGDRFAFPVSEVHGLFRYLQRDLQAPPETLELAQTHYTTALLAWNGQTVNCLDEELLFYTLNKGLA
jgi:chemotaxis-related protein WspD